VTPIIGGAFILTNADVAGADSVKIPYLVIASNLIGVAAIDLLHAIAGSSRARRGPGSSAWCMETRALWSAA